MGKAGQPRLVHLRAAAASQNNFKDVHSARRDRAIHGRAAIGCPAVRVGSVLEQTRGHSLSGLGCGLKVEAAGTWVNGVSPWASRASRGAPARQAASSNRNEPRRTAL